MTNWSERDVLALSNLLDVEIQVNGSGFVTKQSVEKGTKLKKDQKIKVDLNVPKDEDEE